MFHSRLYRKLWLAAAAASLFTVAGCSNQPATEATDQPQSQSAPQPGKASPAPAKKAATPKAVAVSAKVTQSPQTITVPKGTAITAIVGQTLSADKNHTGDSFAATLFTPVKIDGKIVLPQGAHVTGRVVTVKKHELKVTLASVVVRGKSYDLATNSLRPSDKDQAKNNAKSGASASNKGQQKKDNSTLSAKTHLTFKLAKPVTVPAKS